MVFSKAPPTFSIAGRFANRANQRKARLESDASICCRSASLSDASASICCRSDSREASESRINFVSRSICCLSAGLYSESRTAPFVADSRQ